VIRKFRQCQEDELLVVKMLSKLMEKTDFFNVVAEIPHVIKVDEDSPERFMMSRKIIQFMNSMTSN
jgi:hypothetical protein